MRAYILLVLVAAWMSLSTADEKPKFCRKYDCPYFTNKTNGDIYDVRTYGATSWLTTTVPTTTPWPTKEQKRSMFYKLFPYFMGKNSNFKRVSMAVPALFKVHKNGENNYDITMMFYVSQKDAPTPRGSGSTMVTRPAGDVYVRQFQQIKWPSNDKYDENVNELAAGIADKSTFDADTYYRASYNYPFDLSKKQHEVWFDKKA